VLFATGTSPPVAPVKKDGGGGQRDRVRESNDKETEGEGERRRRRDGLTARKGWGKNSLRAAVANKRVSNK